MAGENMLMQQSKFGSMFHNIRMAPHKQTVLKALMCTVTKSQWYRKPIENYLVNGTKS